MPIRITCRGFQSKPRFQKIRLPIEKVTAHKPNGKFFRSFSEPLDVLTYYPPIEKNCFVLGIPCGQVRYDIQGILSSGYRILKEVSVSELAAELVKRIGLPRNQISYNNFACVASTEAHSSAATIGERAHAATNGFAAGAATTGNYSHAASIGCNSRAATLGSNSCAVTSSENSVAMSSGILSHAVTFGKNSHAVSAGDESYASSSGKSSNAVTIGTSSCAAVSGKNSIAASLGIRSAAKANLGSWIVLAERTMEGKLLDVQCARIDGKFLKPDTFYILRHGKIIPKTDKS